MKNKTVITVLSVCAVLLYTVAVICFSLGDVLRGISDVLVACVSALIAYSLYKVEQSAQLGVTTAKTLHGLLELLSNGIPAVLTIKGKEDDDDEEPADDENKEAKNEE